MAMLIQTTTSMISTAQERFCSNLLQLPELAQKDGEALYLHSTSDGRTILYIEGIGAGNKVRFTMSWWSAGR
jgi:hypothetical protein